MSSIGQRDKSVVLIFTQMCVPARVMKPSLVCFYYAQSMTRLHFCLCMLDPDVDILLQEKTPRVMCFFLA